MIKSRIEAIGVVAAPPGDCMRPPEHRRRLVEVVGRLRGEGVRLRVLAGEEGDLGFGEVE